MPFTAFSLAIYVIVKEKIPYTSEEDKELKSIEEDKELKSME